MDIDISEVIRIYLANAVLEDEFKGGINYDTSLTFWNDYIDNFCDLQFKKNVRVTRNTFDTKNTLSGVNSIIEKYTDNYNITVASTLIVITIKCKTTIFLIRWNNC